LSSESSRCSRSAWLGRDSAAGSLISSTSSVIATEKMPSASASILFLPNPSGTGFFQKEKKATSGSRNNALRAQAPFETGGVDERAVDFQREDAELPPAPAIGDDAIALDGQARRLAARGIEDARAQQSRRRSSEACSRAGVGRGERAH